MRIASLVPSATDLVAALGLAPQLVGVSHECDHPAAAGLPIVTRSHIPSAPAADPAVVDEAVRTTVAAGDSLYRVERERLFALEPDLVVGQAICDVCAVSGPEAAAALPPSAKLVTLSATSVAGLFDDLERLGVATGHRAAAEAVRIEVEASLRALPKSPGVRVLTLEWTNPPFLGGHWVPELVEALGAEHLMTRPGQASRTTSYEEARASAPDVVILMPCGYHLEEAVREGQAVTALSSLGAPVWATDASRLFSRCTPSALCLGAQTLSDILQGGPVPSDRARRLSAEEGHGHAVPARAAQE